MHVKKFFNLKRFFQIRIFFSKFRGIFPVPDDKVLVLFFNFGDCCHITGIIFTIASKIKYKSVSFSILFFSEKKFFPLLPVFGHSG